jgi:ABC-type transport system substrate-binding protein
VVKNPSYWKPGRPYLDGVEWTIIPNRSTQTLAFIAGKIDVSFPYEVTLQSMRDIQNQMPNAICEMTPTRVAMNLLINRDAPVFDDPGIRRAMQLAIYRHSSIDTIAEGQGDINGAMQSPPAGLWGLSPEILATLPGYGPDVAANRAEARKLMEKHGYGPDHRLTVKVATRNIAQYRDPAIILIDQMKDIYTTASSTPSRRQTGSRRSRARTTWSAPIYQEVEWTIPTPISSSITPAARSATTPTTATSSSRRCTSSSRSNPTRPNASGGSGRGPPVAGKRGAAHYL